MSINRKMIVLLVMALGLAGCNGSGEHDTVSNTTTETSGTATDEINGGAIDDSEEAIPSKLIAVETAPTNWYIRLTAEDPARSMKTQNAQLGVLGETDAVQKHTLKALTPYGNAYLDIVFRNPDGIEAGDYKVNFHSFAEDSDESWDFIVRTDDTDADILLSWRGVYVLGPYTDDQGRQRYRESRSVTNPIIKHMKLVDLSDGTEIPAAVEGKVQTYTFNMNGQAERIFEWVVQSEEVNLSAQQSRLSTLRSRSLQKDTKLSSMKMMKKKGENFDITKPPMIEEEMYGK